MCIRDRRGAVASADATAPRATSQPGPAAGTVLPVPTYSQMVHSGHYPAWGGGGEAWCSPTSLAMVLAYHGISPAPAGITAGHTDAVVDHTAKMVYDHGYRGTGNWAFNTAYAATLAGGDSYVTRMRDLREVEDYIVAGVPSVDTWVQWAVTIDVPEGDHEVRVRATGRDGETQTSVVRSPDPDGATGWHTVEFSAG